MSEERSKVLRPMECVLIIALAGAVTAQAGETIEAPGNDHPQTCLVDKSPDTASLSAWSPTDQDDASSAPRPSRAVAVDGSGRVHWSLGRINELWQSTLGAIRDVWIRARALLFRIPS